MSQKRPDNYAIQADFARKLFLSHDQSAMLQRTCATADADFLYLRVLGRTCRIHRKTGLHDWQEGDVWRPSLSHNETLTIFDYLCDASPHRTLAGEFVAMSNFGHLFHTNLLEPPEASHLERFIDQNPTAFRSACESLGGTPFPNCDIGFVIPFFPDLPIALAFWHSDEDFPAQLRYFWDKNALRYLRYETMYYALGVLRARLQELLHIS